MQRENKRLKLFTRRAVLVAGGQSLLLATLAFKPSGLFGR